jgi:peptidoglycan/LPS O-acetylase OafA/YrhL
MGRQMLSFNPTRNDTSIALDLLRAVAAQMVCVGHAMAFFHVGDWLKPPFAPRMQNIGVLLFFVMSGFLITATLLRNSENPEYGFGRYFIDRFARIYSGLLPALVFVAVVDWLVAEPAIASYTTLKTWLANVAMLEGYYGVSQRNLQWTAFGSASPLWTLAIEWHIYMFIGAAFFIAKRRGKWSLLIPLALFFGQVPYHYLIGALQDDGVGHGLSLLWLGGGALYLLLSRYCPPLWVSSVALCCSILAYALMVQPGNEYDIVTYPALIIFVGSIVAATQKTKLITRFGSAIGIAAGYSFTLYLIHYTVMRSLKTVFDGHWTAWFLFAVATSNVIAFLIAVPFEMKHKEFAEWLRSIPDRLSEKRSREAISSSDAP